MTPPRSSPSAAGSHREHREHQVADRRVQGVVVEPGHGLYRATRGRDQLATPPPARRRDAGRHPDAVEVAAGHRQRRRQAGADLGDQLGVARAVLRHRVDPALHATSTGSTVTPNTVGQVGDRPGQQLVVGGGAGQSSSPNRPNDSRSNSTLPRGPHLRDDSVIALARKRSPLATSTPECCGNGVPPGTASATTADDATAMRRAAAAVRGATAATSAPAAARGRPAPPRRRASAHPRRRAAASRSSRRSNRSTAACDPVEVGSGRTSSSSSTA